ncbi:hypothetical protein JOQ06_000658, partial [Pogonophryne albipinna]
SLCSLWFSETGTLTLKMGEEERQRRDGGRINKPRGGVLRAYGGLDEGIFKHIHTHFLWVFFLLFILHLKAWMRREVPPQWLSSLPMGGLWNSPKYHSDELPRSQ